MKLCTFEVSTPAGRIQRVGVQTAAGIVDATAARIAFLEQSLPREAAQRVGAAQVPPDMIQLIATGKPALQWVAESVRAVSTNKLTATADGQSTVYAEKDVRLLAPVPHPRAMANFSVWPEHSLLGASKGFEMNTPNQKGARVKPYWKGNPDSVVGPDAELQYPPYAADLDVECELVCIVGTGGKDLSLEQAAEAIAGYTILNDVSARDIQRVEKKAGRGPSKGKDFDGGNVMGPWLVTPDEVGDIRKLRCSLHINGEEVSGQETSAMVWDFAEMLSYISLGQTIYPGQVISGGCYPKGSALDLDKKLFPGDVVELRVTKVGSLKCTIGNQPAEMGYQI